MAHSVSYLGEGFLDFAGRGFAFPEVLGFGSEVDELRASSGRGVGAFDPELGGLGPEAP